MRRTALVTLALSALLAACGGEGNQNPTPDAGLDPVAYFGLQQGRCFEYTTATTPQDSPDLGVLVAGKDSTQVTDTRQTPPVALETFKLEYTVSGAVAMRDYVNVEDGELKLWKRDILAAKSYYFQPGITLAKAPITGGATVNSSVKKTVRDYRTGAILVQDEAHAVRLDVFEPGPVSLPAGATVTAFKMNYDHQPTLNRREVRTFAPGAGDTAAFDGFVKIEFNFNPDEAQQPFIYHLQEPPRTVGASDTPCGMTH